MADLTDDQKKAALALIQPQLDALISSAYAIYAAALGAGTTGTTPSTGTTTTPAASTLPVSPTLLAVSSSGVTVAPDTVYAKGQLISFVNGRTTTITGVATGINSVLSTSEPADDSDKARTALVGTKASVIAAGGAAVATPVASTPATTTPATSTDTTTVTTGTAGSLPLVGVNMSGLGNNPYVENAVAGTHYREPEQKYFDKYKALGCKLIRLPIAPERLVSTNKGALAALYMSQITAALDKASAAGMKVIIDLHSYYRFWTTIAQGAGRTGFQTANYANGNGNGQQVYKEFVPIGVAGCVLDHAGYADMVNKLVAALSSHPAYLGIGLANEPYDGSEVVGGSKVSVNALWLANVQSHVDAAAAASKTGLIFVGGVNWCSALSWLTGSDALKNIKDPNNQVIFEAHQYLDSGMGGGGQWSNRNEVIPVGNGIAMVLPFVGWLELNGKRGYIGEMGFPSGNASAKAATALLIPYLVGRGIPVTQWCAGPGWPSDDVNALDDDNLTYKDNLDAIKPYFAATTTAYGKAGA